MTKKKKIPHTQMITDFFSKNIIVWEVDDNEFYPSILVTEILKGKSIRTARISLPREVWDLVELSVAVKKIAARGVRDKEAQAKRLREVLEK